MHQDTRTLEDQLAERFYEIDPSGKGTLDIRNWASVGHPVRERYLILARECLRQMSWARTQGQMFPRGTNPSPEPVLAPSNYFIQDEPEVPRGT